MEKYKPYKPSKEEMAKAESMMTPKEKEMSKARGVEIKETLKHIENILEDYIYGSVDISSAELKKLISAIKNKDEVVESANDAIQEAFLHLSQLENSELVVVELEKYFKKLAGPDKTRRNQRNSKESNEEMVLEGRSTWVPETNDTGITHDEIFRGLEKEGIALSKNQKEKMVVKDQEQAGGNDEESESDYENSLLKCNFGTIRLYEENKTISASQSIR